MYNSKSPKYKRSPTINTTPFLPRHTSRASSLRRLKIITLLFAITVTLFLFYRSFSSSSSSHDADVNSFYHKTKTALDHDKEDHTAHTLGKDANTKKPSSKAEAVGEAKEDTKQRLQDAAKEAKDKANAKAPKPDPPSSVIGVGSSGAGSGSGSGSTGGKGVNEPGAAPPAGGRKKWSTGEEQKVVKDDKEDESEEDHEVEVELNTILKKAPVIIFSKSYCPHSARAKHILLETYILDPPPYVVELDKHPLGLNLQARLAQTTKRKTVPNILVNGVSIGGGDTIAELDEKKELVDKIRSIAGKKMNEVRPRAGASREREKEVERKGKGGKGGIVRGSDGAI